MAPINWPKLTPAIAKALLGRPVRHTRLEMRYGRKGSLRIDLEKGTFADFESGQSGGMLDLIQSRKGGDAQTAWRWLQDHGLVPRQNGRDSTIPATAPPAQRPRAAAVRADAETQARNAARRLWRGATATDPGALRAYLTRRGCWRPGDPLPAPVRWIDRDAVTAWGWNPLFPAQAAGGMLVAFTDASGTVVAVQIEALTAAGRRTHPRWRKARGRMAGAAFRIPGAGPLRLCEGPIDALAIRTWIGSPAWAAGGAGNMATLADQLVVAGGAVAIHADGEPAGRKAAQAVADRVRRAGRACTLHRSGDGADPASELAEAWNERAAIIEASEHCTRREAETRAWQDWRPAHRLRKEKNE